MAHTLNLRISFNGRRRDLGNWSAVLCVRPDNAFVSELERYYDIRARKTLSMVNAVVSIQLCLWLLDTVAGRNKAYGWSIMQYIWLEDNAESMDTVAFMGG